MFYFQILSSGILVFFLLHVVSSAVLEKLFNEDSACETKCDKVFTASLPLRKSCQEGCRLFTVIDLAKGFSNRNKTLELCRSACSEAFINESSVGACNYGCQHDAALSVVEKESSRTLHLLTPVFYVKSAYNTVAHHVKQFISTSWTIYVQEDSGKMIVLQTNPRVVESSDYVGARDSMKHYQQKWQGERVDWMDCISHQSGLPRWLLLVVLSGFIVALLWLCCVMAVTAPNQYLSTASQKKNVGYVLLCETNPNEIKAPLYCDTEAPPLPQKVSLI